MTKEELKTHCEKTVKSMTMWKNHPSDGGRFFFNPRVLEEHQLILDLINREESVLKALEDVKDKLERKGGNDEKAFCKSLNSSYKLGLKEAVDLLEQKIKEIKHD